MLSSCHQTASLGSRSYKYIWRSEFRRGPYWLSQRFRDPDILRTGREGREKEDGRRMERDWKEKGMGMRNGTGKGRLREGKKGRKRGRKGSGKEGIMCNA